MEVTRSIVPQLHAALELGGSTAAGPSGNTASLQTLVLLSAPEALPGTGPARDKFSEHLSGTGAAPKLPADASEFAELSNKLETSLGDSSFSMTDILKLMLETGSTARKANAQQRRALIDQSIASSEQAAQELKSAAVARLVGGLIGGFGQIAGGATTAYGGFKVMKDLKQADLKQADLQQAAPKFDANSTSNYYQGMGTATTGLGQVGATPANLAADLKQASSQEYDIQSKQYDKLEEETKQVDDSLKEFVLSVLSAAKEYEAAMRDVNSRTSNA